jgi:hypothetical protein
LVANPPAPLSVTQAAGLLRFADLRQQMTRS